MKAASLSSSLLATKGTARPTLSPESVSPYAAHSVDGYRLRAVKNNKRRPEFSEGPSKLETLKSTVRVKNKDKRFHNSVHLDAEAHKMLRMLAARRECTLQMIMEQAITHHLNKECDTLACICQLDKKD